MTDERWEAVNTGRRWRGTSDAGVPVFKAECTEPGCGWWGEAEDSEATSDAAFVEHYTACHDGEVVGVIPPGQPR